MKTIQDSAGARTLANASSEAALTATSGGEDETPLVLVEQFLNEFGRSMPEELLRHVVAGQQQESGAGQQAPAFLTERLWFVLDSSSLQVALRSCLRHGRASLVDGMKAGFIRVTAPLLLDSEIQEHAAEIAESCEVTVEQVLARYLEIRPMIEFRRVSVEQVQRLRLELRDPNDADFVAHLMDVDSLGIITQDKDFEGVPEVRTFAIADVNSILLTYRKQAVVLLCVVPPAAIVADASKPIFAAAAALCAAAKRNPGMVVGIAALIAALGVMFPKERKQLVSRLRGAASNLSARWSVVEPWAFACVQALASRVQEAQSISKSLGLASAARDGGHPAHRRAAPTAV